MYVDPKRDFRDSATDHPYIALSVDQVNFIKFF